MNSSSSVIALSRLGPGKSPPPNKTRPLQHQQSTANAAKEHKPSGSVSSTNSISTSTSNAIDDKCWFCGLVGHRKYDCEEFKRAWIALKKQGHRKYDCEEFKKAWIALKKQGHRKYDCEEFKKAWIALKKQGHRKYDCEEFKKAWIALKKQ
eukprot:gene2946-biopygen416